MMRFFKGTLIVFLLVGVCFTATWAADAPWKKAGETNGITGYTRPTTMSSIDQMKGVGIVNASVAAVEAVIRDVPAQKEFMYMCGESSPINTPELKSGGDTIYVYNVTDMPFPVNDRDAVAKADYTIDKATGTVYIHIENVKTTYKSDKNKVRMPLVIVDYTLAPKGPDKTEVTYIALAEPAGNLPAFVVNLLGKNLGMKTVAKIGEMAKRDKYKNVKTVVTTTPH